MVKRIEDDLELQGVLYAFDIQFIRGRRGDILYKGIHKWKKRGIGNLGQVLTVDVNGEPVWAAPGGGCILAQGTYVGTGVGVQQQINLPTIADPKHAIVLGIGVENGMAMHRLEKEKTMHASVPPWTCAMSVFPATPGPVVGNITDDMQFILNAIRVTGVGNVLGYVYHYTVWG